MIVVGRSAEGPVSYTRNARMLHWGMASIIIAVWCIGFYTAHLRGDTPRGGFSLELHESIASTVIFLVALRLLYRLTRRYPSLPAEMSAPMVLAVKLAHVLLYGIVMIAAPLTGMVWTSAAGYAVPVLGLFHLPQLIGKDAALYDVAMWAHRWVVWSAGFLIAVHIAAALKHHFLDRDDILTRMLPARRLGTDSNVSETGVS